MDRIQENRNLWLQAGGCDPEILATPSEMNLEEVKRVLATLDAMLEKNGPRGGLDSFVAEIKAPCCTLPVRRSRASLDLRVPLAPRGCRGVAEGRQLGSDPHGLAGGPPASQVPARRSYCALRLLAKRCPKDRFILTPQGMCQP